MAGGTTPKETESTTNLAFQLKCELLGEKLGMQVQAIDDKTVYLVAPIEKTAGKGMTVEEAIISIGEIMGVIGGSFGLDANKIKETVETITPGWGDKCRLCLKMAYLYSVKKKTNENGVKCNKVEVSEYAISIGVRFDSGEDGETKPKAVSLDEMSFCVWSFSGDGPEVKARRKIIEDRMGIVDLGTPDKILQYIDTTAIDTTKGDELKPLEGKTTKIKELETKKDTKEENKKNKAKDENGIESKEDEESESEDKNVKISNKKSDPEKK